MHLPDRWRLAAFATILISRQLLWATSAAPQRSFSVRDDIELTKFDDVALSPQKDMVLVHTERASLADGMIHDQFSVYTVDAIRRALRGNGPNLGIDPVWSFERRTKDNGNNAERVSGLRWLDRGKAFAFLYLDDPNRHRLYLAEVILKSVVPLSRASDDVLGFDIRDAAHFVFTVASHEAGTDLKRVQEAPSRVGTGLSLEELAFPQDLLHFVQRGELWMATGGAPRPVLDRRTRKPITLYSDGNDSLTLAPNGSEAVALEAVADVPANWVESFPPPYPESAYRLKAHHQDLTAPYDGWTYVSEWIRIRLSDGEVTLLTNAPAALRAGWWEVHTSKAAWSDDSSLVVLPGTFTQSESGKEARPCILAVRLSTSGSECVRPLKRQFANGFEQGWEAIDKIEFAPGRNDEILLGHENGRDIDGRLITVYRRLGTGRWGNVESRRDYATSESLTIRVEQSFKDPPILTATDRASGRSRVILDPNPQLKSIRLGAAEPYQWRDGDGRDWQGILYKPVDYVPGKRYPLVIQNHGFSLDRFLPSGSFPSAFVAEELASAGIMVLQVRDCAGRGTPIEGPCNVAGYESAVEQLTRDGRIDASRVGMIGFSRTVFYALEAMTKSHLSLKAASIMDGITLGYLDYLQCVGLPAAFNDEKAAMIGAKPFGPGLAEWLKASPDFHLDQVTAPLRVVATAGPGVVEMWEPYAVLEAMQKPVDLIVLNTREHILADPAMRLIAQTGNVDWFRFWLQGYENPDPAKRAQYRRWRQLRDRMNGNDVR